MPYLGDYLGQLLSEISMARMQADLETVRLAELYAAHPLLRTMPVPHMRLPDVDLEVPVLIRLMEEPQIDMSARGGATVEDLGRTFDEVLAKHVATTGVKLSSTQSKKLRAALNDRLKSPGTPTEVSVDVNRLADDLSSTALRFLGEQRPGPGIAAAADSPELADELKDAVRLAFLRIRTQPPRLDVMVTSAEIREAGTPENLMRLRLKVSEQGLEWKRIESNGVQHDRLVPE